MQVRYLLMGLGNVGRRFLELVERKRDTLEQGLGLELVMVGAADRSGAAMCPGGLDPREVVQLKAKGQGAADYPEWGRPGLSALEMIQSADDAYDCRLLLDATPANLTDGQPGLGCIEEALLRGMYVVTANKAPLVLAFPRLLGLARTRGVRLCFDATVAGGLPAVNLGQRDLAAAHIHRLEGVVNLTTNYILTRMGEEKCSYDAALKEAQEMGIAETDPTLDVEGYDTRNKLVLITNTLMNQTFSLEDVDVKGITDVNLEDIDEALTSSCAERP